jgi:hypothetical protein
MKNYKNSIFYIVIIGFFSFLMYWIFKQGKILEDVTVQEKISENSNWQDFINSLTHNLQHPLAILLAQIVTIILVAKLFGWICRKIGQYRCLLCCLTNFKHCILQIVPLC